MYKKANLPKKQKTLLGFTVTLHGVNTTKQKYEAIIKFKDPKTLKHLHSFIGCIHHLINFISNLELLSEPWRPLFKNAQEIGGESKPNACYNTIKATIRKIKKKNIPIQTNKSEFAATLAKKDQVHASNKIFGTVWEPVIFASNFLNKLNHKIAQMN